MHSPSLSPTSRASFSFLQFNKIFYIRSRYRPGTKNYLIKIRVISLKQMSSITFESRYKFYFERNRLIMVESTFTLSALNSQLRKSNKQRDLHLNNSKDSSDIFDNNCDNVYDDVYETTKKDAYHDQYEIDPNFIENKKSKLQRFQEWFNDIGRLSIIKTF